MQEEKETHYLGEEFEQKTIPVSSGKRFANLIIDNIVIIIFTYAFDFILLSLQITRYDDNPFVAILFNYLIFAVLMFIMETFLKGKSIGKLVTKTRAVNIEDGSYISTRTALLRSISRLVPFEAFSALGSPCVPWHDKWTGSVVVED